MTRTKALSVALSVAVAIGLAAWVYVGPVSAHPGNTCNPPAGHGNPGCHVSATTTKATTTTKASTTTTTKQTTTTAKPTTTTKATTTTTTKASTTTTTKQTTTTASNTTTTLQPTTTTASTTTTTASTTTTLMPAAVLSLSPVDPKYLYESPDDRETMEAARAIVAGLAVSGAGGPPDGSGPAGGSPSDGTAGVNDVAAGDPATGGDAVVSDATAGDAAETGAAMGPSYYYVSPVAIIFLLVYATSFILYKTKSIRMATHRKIWNVLLLATFFVTGAFGLILAVGMSQDPPWVLPQWLLFWHVEIGIMMSFISVFHLGWRASTTLRSSPAERVPAVIP